MPMDRHGPTDPRSGRTIALEEEMRKLRIRMVREQIESRGIHDLRVLEAMRSVPRHLFVPPELIWEAYDDNPLPIGEGQTISQPYMVAWMTELLRLKGEEKVLEVGTGSGYQAAILGRLAREVWSVEKEESLARQAEERLRRLGLDNVRVVVGDGSRGLPEHAPYDAVMVTAGSPNIPQPLLEQLAEGGRLVIPVGPSSLQMLNLVIREGNDFRREEKGGCVFVPLVGKFGWRRGRRLY